MSFPRPNRVHFETQQGTVGDPTGYSRLPGFVVIIFLLFSCTLCQRSQAQLLHMGTEIPPEVDAIYERGLAFLARTQDPQTGSWRGRRENGVTGLCLMAFLAGGEDPNFGRYRRNVRLAIRALIMGQDKSNGYFPNSMYHHGFALLALAEAYGAVDEATLWNGSEGLEDRRSIAEAIEQGIDLAGKAQNNNRWGGWRYSPTSTDADTSVTGSVLMGLLACRNAGFNVPGDTIDKALNYMKRNTATTSGYVAYSGGLGGGTESVNRSAVATLVYSVGQKKEWEEYEAVSNHISERLKHRESGHRHYYIYYMAQALFQADYESWVLWNRTTARKLASEQAQTGSFTGSYGEAYGTAMSLLALALNYRFLPIYERF
ncbi:MAG: squalene--hopene cyclase [Verrucomicrobiales bacterium]|nr:squalene--hopene cyclase [Verrucomicrobiales bacterium]